MSKNLIIYYSRKGQNYVNGRIESLTKGNTEICAEFIQKAVGGDLFEVETVNGYSSDYHACTAEAKTELYRMCHRKNTVGLLLNMIKAVRITLQQAL